ncbi:MAG: hypothetical protein IIC83_02945 [Chloroflexi bacterium]|nr:hypothetical protein [Chloroflexota bacterium]
MTMKLSTKNLAGVISDTWSFYRSNFWKIVSISTLVQIPAIFVIGGSVIGLFFLVSYGVYREDSSFGTMLGIILPGSAFVVFAMASVFVIFEGVVTHAICQHYAGQPVNVRQAFILTRRRFFPMLGAFLAVFVPIGAIMIIIFALGAVIDNLGIVARAVIHLILPLVYLGVRWFFVLQVAILEDRRPLACLSRSSELVNGNWWRVLGFISVAMLINFAMSFINLIPIIGFLVATIVVTPAYFIAQTVLYCDLRLRAEGAEQFNEAVLAGNIGLAPVEEEGWSKFDPA